MLIVEVVATYASTAESAFEVLTPNFREACVKISF